MKRAHGTEGAPAAVGLGGTGEVGALVDCSQADDRRLIALVRARRLLYARNNMPVASYYTQVKSLWEEVAREMGWSVADVRRTAQVVAHPQLVLAAPAQRAARRVHEPRPAGVALVPGGRAGLPA